MLFETKDIMILTAQITNFVLLIVQYSPIRGNHIDKQIDQKLIYFAILIVQLEVHRSKLKKEKLN